MKRCSIALILIYTILFAGEGESNQQQNVHGGGEEKVTKTVSRKKKNNPETLYLILIEAVRHAVNFKTRYSRNTSFKLHAIDLEALSVSQI